MNKVLHLYLHSKSNTIKTNDEKYKKSLLIIKKNIKLQQKE